MYTRSPIPACTCNRYVHDIVLSNYVLFVVDECPICLSDFTDPFKTKCGHVFCRHCISEALQHSSFCPTCKAALRAIVGNQPVGGTMNVQVSTSVIKNYIAIEVIASLLLIQ